MIYDDEGLSNESARHPFVVILSKSGDILTTAVLKTAPICTQFDSNIPGRAGSVRRSDGAQCGTVPRTLATSASTPMMAKTMTTRRLPMALSLLNPIQLRATGQSFRACRGDYAGRGPV